ncbi:lycopene beta-cyclase subunit alpha [Brevibacterium aurantiacum]|uniref:Lycopene cyclase n=1 Tax=Brevibacterium aurantiacum TaxID=273384 RepID=A0A1D7W730_BREAU|nr:lycopene beta-cyclase subunit alpha [Brevibacterium aurantiacum]AOP54811.1 Lycopene cyclase [Brevibacterium aurantiacum]AZT94521.1 lycopene cyclase domain-containing protein [Brevibacterium aurantiacum]AZT98310.1 lycopene cyclase domain-containing protein [Brevibacterium aurantiacum]PCC54056.1 lycopene cyclase [Brevibacterium aurantiacum]RCS95752.1 lycopene cyclase domain-containing protein [Brevibacterium aurantiacum]
MSAFEYLLLMGACLLITLPLELLFSARVYRRPKLLIGSLIPIILIFSLWDIIAIDRDHWTYNQQFVTGIHIGNLPLEELVFFIVIPICALLSYEAVGTVLKFVAKKSGTRAGRKSGNRKDGGDVA